MAKKSRYQSDDAMVGKTLVSILAITAGVALGVGCLVGAGLPAIATVGAIILTAAGIGLLANAIRRDDNQGLRRQSMKRVAGGQSAPRQGKFKPRLRRAFGLSTAARAAAKHARAVKAAKLEIR